MYYPFRRFWHNVERQREREIYAEVHARLYVMGYAFQISFYGTTETPYDGSHYQARIEVLTQHELDESEIIGTYAWLSHYMPDREYTLFVDTDKGFKQVVCL